MPQRNLPFIVCALWLCALTGCGDQAGKPLASKKGATTQPAVPPHVKGTVAEFAALAGAGETPVQAYGLVVGLGTSGSSEVPAHIAKAMEQYLYKQNLGSAMAGTTALTPKRVLEDLDTAVVLVGASAPTNAPIGTRFDVFVTALPQTQTRSLDGGILMPIDLTLAYGGVIQPYRQTQSWGSAAGSVFVNPFIDPADPQDQPKLRSGRVINGGEVTRPPVIRLQLFRADYAQAKIIENRINERFPAGPEAATKRSLPSSAKTANALSRSVIELNIPKQYQADYQHFLRLVMHLPVHDGEGGPEAYARRIAVEMEKPDANCEELALVWEATGRQVLNLAQTLYTSKEPAVAFYSARAGVRLGDMVAGEVILRHAANAESPLQIEAIEELARHRPLTQADQVLRPLLDSSSESVRVAAYEALLTRGDRTSVTRIDISGRFKLDLVATAHEYSIYATQTGEPKIVLFGRDMKVSPPLFFEAPGELVTITAKEGSDKLSAFRLIPRTGGFSDQLECDGYLRSLIELLGRTPEKDDAGQIRGLGLAYSQILGVLYRMGEQGDIPAKLVLQPMAEVQRIYEESPSAGRPD